MRKSVLKLILILTVMVMVVTAFIACEKKQDINIEFVSEEKVVSNALSIEEAKELLESQPQRDGYLFDGWFLDEGTWQQEVLPEDVAQYVQNGHLTVYAHWVEITDGITVTFYDYTGAILLANHTFNRDNVNLDFLKASKKPDDEKYTYTFSGWDCDMSDLSKSHYNAHPVYDSELRTFDVQYVIDGVAVYTQKVKYGENADTSVLVTPKKDSTPEYDYVFAGWQGNTQNITSDTQLVAQFTPVRRQYTVTFKYGDNQVLSQKVYYGEAAKAPNASEVKKSPTAQYDFVFTGWDNVFDKVTDNITVNALYSQTLRVFTVDFYMDDTLLKSESVVYGYSATAPEKVVKPADKYNTYEFIGWDDTFDNVTSNLEIRAQFDATPILYTVTFIDWNDAVLGSDEVEYLQPASLGFEPHRDSNDMYDYTFTGWSQSVDSVEDNMTVKAQYSQTLREFNVTFNYGDGETLTQTVTYGEAAIAPEDVSKSETESTVYVFIGWDYAFDCVTSDMTITAQYREDVREYEVKFMVDDICIKSEIVLYGNSATAPETVVKVKDDGYTYEFTGWDKAFDNITENTVVNALFNQIAHIYTVQYVNWDGEILFTDSVSTDEASVYEGETPVRESNDRFTYTFTGWTDSDALDKVTKDTTVYAIYDAIERTYTVTFYYGHDMSVVIENVPYGTDLTDASNEFGAQVPTDTSKTSTAQYDYTFIDWDRYFGYISCDLDITAIYKETVRKYTVTFVNDGTIVKTQEVEYGSCATAPELAAYKNDTAQYDYTYLGWGKVESDIVENVSDFTAVDVSAETVVGDVTYTAVYLREVQQYTVTFYNDQTGTEYSVVATLTVPYGTDLTDGASEFGSQVPVVTKDSTIKYDYTFSGWDKDISFIQSNMEVRSTYTETIRKYTVTFINDGAVYAEYVVEYGTSSPIPEDPTKQSTEQYDFVFIGWIGGTSFIEGDTTIEADYRNDLRYYQISFYDITTNKFIETVEMGYGSSITKTIEKTGYTFDSWYKDPYCNTVFDMANDVVKGKMTLFGNLYMTGLQFNSNNEITGYDGTEGNLIIPAAANGKKVTTIVDEAFMDNAVIDTVYIPDTITSVGDYAFSGVEVAVYVQKKNVSGGNLVTGWSALWYLDHKLINAPAKDIYFNIEQVYYSTDYRYLLVSDNTAIIGDMINNNTARAYIDETVSCDLSVYTEYKEIDEKTGIEWTLYSYGTNTKTYNITQIGKHAYAGCSNLKSIFIPDTIQKVHNYAFSGVSANLYIQRDEPAIGSVPAGWGWSWNSNDGDDEGTRVLYWGVIDMYESGDYSFILLNDYTAVAAEYIGSTSVLSVEVPASVTYNDTEFVVAQLGDELFANMSLLNTVTLHEGLKTIGSKVFYMDMMLSSITLPSTLTSIGDYAFLGTMSLKEIYIPASVESVGFVCFAGSNATIYCGIEESIIGGAYNYRVTQWNIKLGFEDISNLTSLDGIWSLITNPTYLPTYYNVKYVYNVEATETGRSTTFKYILYNDNNARLIGYSTKAMLTVQSYTIPSTIEYNGETFNVVSIGANALNGAKLSTLFVPASVTYLEANAFAGCSGMTINTAHSSQPEDWTDGFNPDGCTINYGVAV